jgi:hypothetical protein
MHALKAQVKNGRIVVDEPTDLPEGTVVHLIPTVEEEMAPEERAELKAALEESLEEMRAGKTLDGAELVAELRSRL